MASMEKSKDTITMQVIAGVVATLSTLSVGFHSGWAAPSLPKLLADDSDIPITSDQSSWIVGFYSVGGVFGAFMGAPLIDRFGRKLSLLTTVIPHIIACILFIMAKSYWWLIMGRFLGGFSSGMTYVIAPPYLAEIAEDRIRGALGATLTVMMDISILLCYVIGPWVSRSALAAVGGVFSLIFVIMFIWMPESPYYLIMKDKHDQAEKSLMWLRGKKSVSEEFDQLRKNVEFDRENAGTIKDLIMKPGNRKALGVIIAVLIAQQCSGISAILGYSGMIFKAAGSTLDSNTSVIIIGAVQLLSVILTILTVDLAGRRTLILSSVAGSSIFSGGVALYFQLKASGNDVSGISWLPVTAMIGFMIFYTIGLGSLPFVILSELFPYNVKAVAGLVGSIMACIFGFIMTKLYQIVADGYGIHFSFWGFALITASLFIIIYFTLPETKQRSFRSIQEQFHKTTESTTELSKSEVA